MGIRKIQKLEAEVERTTANYNALVGTDTIELTLHYRQVQRRLCVQAKSLMDFAKDLLRAEMEKGEGK